MFKATYSRTRVREYSKSNELLKTYLILYGIIITIYYNYSEGTAEYVKSRKPCKKIRRQICRK